MSDIEQVNESGANTESTASSETASPAQSQEAGQEQQAQPQVKQEVPTHFHEHPRFQELITKNREYSDMIKQMQAQVQQLTQTQQKQLTPKQQPEGYDDLLAEMERHNRKFAKFQREMKQQLQEALQARDELKELKSWQSQTQAERDSAQAMSQFDKLCTDTKIPPGQKKFYQSYIANMANATGAKVQDLPDLFAKAHAELSKDFEDMRRADRESYVAGKQGDKKPATQSGGVAPSFKKSGPMSPDEIKAEFVAQIKAAKAGVQ